MLARPLFLLALPAALAAQPSRQASDSLLVSPEWLAARLSDPTLVVVHVAGGKAAYDTAHVPGARHLAYDRFVREMQDHDAAGLHTELPDLAALERALEAIGVSDDSRVVLYGPSSTIVTRLFATLEHVGLTGRASVLDGGLARWRTEGRPVSREAPPARTGSLTLRPSSPAMVDAAWVRARLDDPKVTIVDARAPQFYEGSAPPDRYSTRPGHILGAVSVPFTDLVNNQGSYRSIVDMRKRFDAAGVKPGSSVVTYCHIGQQGSVAYFVARLLGHEARLYDGSYEDWSRRTDHPIATGKSPR